LLRALVMGELKVGPVYVTEDVFIPRDSGERELTQWLNQNFQGIPKGLVFQIFQDREFHDPGELNLQMRGLTNGTRRFEEDDVVKLKVIPAYRSMLKNRGLYLDHFNQPERAAAARDQAEQLLK
jgi:hypothetical protein